MRQPNIFDWWGNAMQVGLVMAEAQAVIAMRLWGMAGVWSVTEREDSRMISEKVWAMTKGSTDSAKAFWSGAAPDAIAAAAIQPVRRTTRANYRRLSKRGPKLGS